MTKEQIYLDIFTTIPEFTSERSLTGVSPEDETYSLLSSFGICLRDAIESEQLAIIDKSFKLLNSWINIGDASFNNKIRVGILEVLTDTKASQFASIEKLDSEGKKMFLSLFDRFVKLID